MSVALEYRQHQDKIVYLKQESASITNQLQAESTEIIIGGFALQCFDAEQKLNHYIKLRKKKRENTRKREEIKKRLSALRKIIESGGGYGQPHRPSVIREIPQAMQMKDHLFIESQFSDIVLNNSTPKPTSLPDFLKNTRPHPPSNVKKPVPKMTSTNHYSLPLASRPIAIASREGKGKWCAAHVELAWKIYNAEQRNKILAILGHKRKADDVSRSDDCENPAITVASVPSNKRQLSPSVPTSTSTHSSASETSSASTDRPTTPPWLQPIMEMKRNAAALNTTRNGSV